VRVKYKQYPENLSLTRMPRLLLGPSYPVQMSNLQCWVQPIKTRVLA
jgi:hypothetical protein